MIKNYNWKPVNLKMKDLKREIKLVSRDLV